MWNLNVIPCFRKTSTIHPFREDHPRNSRIPGQPPDEDTDFRDMTKAMNTRDFAMRPEKQFSTCPVERVDDQKYSSVRPYADLCLEKPEGNIATYHHLHQFM